MNRETKFRAWDRSTKKMLRVVNVKHGFRKLEDGEITVSQLFDEACDCLTPMQFTGLSDRNGVDIYEGDILAYDEARYVVEWSDTRLGFVWRGVLDWGDSFHGQTTDEQRWIEVIGNIYENPDLLK